MLNKLQIEHSRRLEEIIRDVSLIKESPVGISWIMKEGLYLKDGFKLAFPDIVLGYSGFAIPVEYKHSVKHKSHAIQQLRNGITFVEGTLGLQCPHVRFVSYNERRDRYVSEIILREAFD